MVKQKSYVVNDVHLSNALINKALASLVINHTGKTIMSFCFLLVIGVWSYVVGPSQLEAQTLGIAQSQMREVIAIIPETKKIEPDKPLAEILNWPIEWAMDTMLQWTLGSDHKDNPFLRKNQPTPTPDGNASMSSEENPASQQGPGLKLERPASHRTGSLMDNPTQILRRGASGTHEIENPAVRTAEDLDKIQRGESLLGPKSSPFTSPTPKNGSGMRLERPASTRTGSLVSEPNPLVRPEGEVRGVAGEKRYEIKNPNMVREQDLEKINDLPKAKPSPKQPQHKNP